MTNNQNTNFHGKITRRSMMQFAVVGGLVVVAGLQVALRCLRPQNKLGVTEITIEGPFNYGSFKLEDLKYKEIQKSQSSFVLRQIVFSETKYFEKVFISFTLTGVEDINRKINVFLTVLDKEGEVIGESRHIFEDPRVVSRTWSGVVNGIEILPLATLSVRLKHEKGKSNIFSIGKIVVGAINLY